MKILTVFPELTHPVDAGNKRWVISQTEELKRLGHEVYILCVNIPGLKSDVIARQKKLVQTKEHWGNHGFVYNAPLRERIAYSFYINYRRAFCNGYYKCDDLYPRGLGKYVGKLQEEYHFDACIVNYYWLTRIFKDVQFRYTAVNTHDVFSYRDILTGTPFTWMCTTPNEEAKGLQRAKKIFALQDEERIYFEHIAPKSEVSVVYCPYRIDFLPTANNHNLLMLSSSNTFNVRGFKWFCDNVFPSIVEVFPDVKVVVAGNICEEIPEYAENEHFSLLGPVDDPSQFYRLGDVVINPCQTGTGLKIKTFEALSYGRIAMAHPHSTTGIYKKESAPVFSSVDASEWVEFLKDVWSDTTVLAAQMKKGAEYIEAMNNHIEKEYVEFLK